MSQRRLRYSEFCDRIDVDAFEEAIGWTPESQQGDNDVGFCLWPENHKNGDTTGKFGIHREKRIYNCYVCGGGSLLSLAMEALDLDVEQATKFLFGLCGDDLRDDNEFVDDFLESFKDVNKRVETLPYFNERVLEKYDTDVPTEVLDKWHISATVAEEFHLRYSDEAYRKAPSNSKWSGDEYKGPGIIFPHYWKERLVGWQTRWLEDGRPEWIPKYTMTTDFPKENTLWGYDQALEDGGIVVVVESVPSALFALSGGSPAVATFGSNLNPAQLRLLRRFSDGVILCPDNDKPLKDGGISAGWKWRQQITSYLKHFVPVYHGAFVPGQGSDLADLESYAKLYEYLDEIKLYGVDL